MLEYIKTELLKHGICDVGTLPLSMCRINRAYKLEKSGFDGVEGLSVVIFAIPYYTKHTRKNISSYAAARDYHLFCNELFASVLPRLKEKYQGRLFAGFADDSPIDERHAAALSGLGIIGDNGMLITEKYSSYVFLAEIVTNLPIKHENKYELLHCESCEKCLDACPSKEIGECLSALTQKKGELSEKEKNAIKSHGSAWGCDICQEVCPHTKRALALGTIYTEIPFFKESLLPCISSDIIMNMDDTSFSSRAYSWRKRDTILRNLKILEENNEI